MKFLFKINFISNLKAFIMINLIILLLFDLNGSSRLKMKLNNNKGNLKNKDINPTIYYKPIQESNNYLN
jgi:hypothetical protein